EDRTGDTAHFSITLSSETEETGFAFTYGTTSQGPPEELVEWVSLAVELTQGWFEERVMEKWAVSPVRSSNSYLPVLTNQSSENASISSSKKGSSVLPMKNAGELSSRLPSPILLIAPDVLSMILSKS
ncbi:MAG: hypothetical protein AAFR66_21430, partial [Bacteroidota bacterium]